MWIYDESGTIYLSIIYDSDISLAKSVWCYATWKLLLTADRWQENFAARSVEDVEANLLNGLNGGDMWNYVGLNVWDVA